ncbi:MAG: hypothetical protein HDR15_02920 [Lachnospiraceae bacterium]|nr:hypothetical protein [Lachnospiraceae bacterium]
MSNIMVKFWQVSLEKEYGIKYEEAKTLSNEYREKYYSMEDAMDFYCIILEGIIYDAKKIVKQNFIIILVDIVLFVVTLILINFMYMVFRCNKKIACIHPNRATSIILFIEIAISMLTCFMDIKGSIEAIEQYQNIYGLI